MMISQSNRFPWRLLIGLMIAIPLTASVPCTIGAKPTSLIKRSIQPTAEQMQLLQQSLSITELDKNINRIWVQETAAVQQRKRIERMLQRQEVTLRQKRAQVDRVLCSFYIGEQATLLQAILAGKQVHDRFLLFEYFQALLQTDYDLLNAYKEQISTLHQLRNRNARLGKELSNLRTQLITQRDRLAKLQKKLDADVSASSNPTAMNKLIQAFTSYWQNIGLVEVQSYFRALAKSMKKLPDFIKNSGEIQIEGTDYMIMIPEKRLNLFLQEQDPMFKVLTFQFKDGEIAAEGERSGMTVRVAGHYTIESEPENRILFHIDHIFFNGLELPASTRHHLEQSFDLSFYPKKLIPFVEAKAITIADKMITVKLSLDVL